MNAADSDHLGLTVNIPSSIVLAPHDSQQISNKRIIEHVTFDVQENASSNKLIKRRGIFTHYNDAQGTIVICHGFMADKYDVRCLRYLFGKRRFNTFVFDFRAHGDDTQGQCCTFGKDEALDVIGAVRFVRGYSQYAQKPIIGYGMSMGAVAAIEAQASNDALFDALILDCPFASSERVIQFGLRNAKLSLFGYKFDLPCKAFLAKYASHPYVQPLVKYLLRTKANLDTGSINTMFYSIYPSESAKKITIPCFFIHCKNDEKVSADDIRLIYASVQGFKRLWITNGRHHYDSLFYNPEQYKKRVNAFVRSIIDGSHKTAQQEEIVEDEPQELLSMSVNNV